MKLSFIVPAFNEERLLPSTLQSIKKAAVLLTHRGWDWEVVVCDNNSTDQTAAIARDHGARVVFEPINQIARSRNTGAASAKGEWFLFLDADSRISGDLLEEAARLIEEGRILFAGAVVELDTELPRMEAALVGAWNLLSRVCRWMAGSFILVEAAAFREAGGFNVDLFAGEELDLSRRLKRIARWRRKRVTIITRHPLVTSSRRILLYSRGELLRFMLRALWSPLSTPRSQRACAMWYDGRR